jgi:hypothetical protein
MQSKSLSRPGSLLIKSRVCRARRELFRRRCWLTIAHLSTRLDAIIAQRADQARRDAEREAEEEAKRIQAELNALPDPDDPDPDAHHPAGDLHSLPATEDPELEIEDQAEFPEEPEDPTGTVIPQPTAVGLD